MVTAIIAAGRNRTIDYNASQACDVVIKVFICIETAWNGVRRCSAICCVPLFACRRASLLNTNNLVIRSKNGEANVQCGQRKMLFSE